MQRNTPGDYVILGYGAFYALSSFNIEDGKWLFNRLDQMGLSDIKDRLIPKLNREGGMDGEDICEFIAAELSKIPTDNLNPPYDTTNLIGSIKPGVLSRMPPSVQKDLIRADTLISGGNNEAAALVLSRSVEVSVKHLYQRWFQKSPENLTWYEVEERLLGDKPNFKTLSPSVFAVRDIRINYRNPITHPSLTENDVPEDSPYEVVELWHSAIKAFTRIARVLETLEPLPKEE